MKNIIYQAPSYTAAKAFIERNKVENAMIDSHVTGSRTDANGVLLEQVDYDVYLIISEN